MMVFLWGMIAGVLLALLPLIGEAVVSRVKRVRRIRLNRAVDAELARRQQVATVLDVEWWDEPKPGVFRSIPHP